jgi:hypothetical protein
MKRTSTFEFGRLLRNPQLALRLGALLLFLILVQGAPALSGEEGAASALTPANLLATVERQAVVVYGHAQNLASNLRLAYEIQVFLADEGVESEATPAVETEQASCSLSATGLIHSWID